MTEMNDRRRGKLLSRLWRRDSVAAIRIAVWYYDSMILFYLWD